MNGAILTAFAVYAVLGGVATTNEISHGWVAEHMGIGHQHLIDHGGYHCHHDLEGSSDAGTGNATDRDVERCHQHHRPAPDRTMHHHDGGGWLVG